MSIHGEPQAPAIFDRALLVRRRDLIADTAHHHDFLLQRVTDDLAERLAVVRRQFPIAAVLGAHHGVLGERLRRLETIERVIELDSSPRMLSLCRGPRILADEELLPLRDEAVELVASALSLQFVNDLPGTLLQVRRA